MAEIAVIIKTDGTRERVEFEVGDSYNMLSDTVGGLIECVALPTRGVDMWINEEGKYTCEYQNPRATALWHEYYGPTDIIMGNIILCRCNDEGETIGLTEQQVEDFMGFEGNLTLMSAPIDPEFKF